VVDRSYLGLGTARKKRTTVIFACRETGYTDTETQPTCAQHRRSSAGVPAARLAPQWPLRGAIDEKYAA
jgi:hypothetical protein